MLPDQIIFIDGVCAGNVIMVDACVVNYCNIKYIDADERPEALTMVTFIRAGLIDNVSII